MQEQFTARLFGPGLAPTGIDATLSMLGGSLEVRSGSGSQRITIDGLRIREVVSTEAGLELSWDSPRGAYAAHVAGAAAIRALRSHPSLQGSAQLNALRSRQRRNGIGRTLGWSAVGLFVLLPVLLLAVFIWQASRFAGAIAERIPVQQEQQIGRQVFSGMRGTMKLLESGADADLVRSLGTRLSAGSRYTYEFHVVQDDTLNAFALPGGVIVVHTGLIKATKRPEELAGVLAHEVQHVELRHSLQAMIKELGLRGLWAAATGDIGGTLAGEALLKITSLRFSRDAEREADARGFEVLVRNDIDPSGMVDFFGTMAREAGAGPPAWLSTHPASESRQQALRAMLDQLGGRSFPPLATTP
jgi:Zn-dependent protease with chaperone function